MEDSYRNGGMQPVIRELTDLTKVYESPVVQIEIRRRGQINYSLTID